MTFILQRQHYTIGKIMMLNPIAQVIQDMRHFIVYSGNMRGWELINNNIIALVPYVIPFVILAIGYSIFHKYAKKFSEIL